MYKIKKYIIKTGADAIALGRGIKGNPWFVKECIEYIENNRRIDRPKNSEIKGMMIRHINDAIEFKGEFTAISELRHHLSWYTKGMENSSEFRFKLNSVNNKNELIELIKETLE